jgi:hypothetical protein
MKPKTKTFIVTLIALMILAAPAWAGKVSKDTSATIRETIKEQVKHPGFYNLKENTCCADVIFTISNEGKLLVKRIISNSEDLSDYLTKALSDIQFYKLQSPMNQYYRIKISFRLI